MDDSRSRDIGAAARLEYRGVRLYENSWALVIGVNNYRHPGIPRLQFAESDAASVAAALPALGFPRENIFVL